MNENNGHPLRAYVFVNTEAGKTRTVVRGISELRLPRCRILTVEQVIGGCDIIAKIETPDLDSLARAITDGIREVDGVVDVVASWCCDGRDISRPALRGRSDNVNVVSAARR
jgi:DNA-binding Lrp family transcriptional regulator